MEYTNLGRTGLSVSRLCLGTMNFGKQTDEITASAVMDQAQEAGINIFGTKVHADMGDWRTSPGKRVSARP